jgi:DNA polymerase elongation subunit (family B)
MFLDIETVPQRKSLDEMPEEIIHLWEEKFNALKTYSPARFPDGTAAADAFTKNAGIYAEFGKIVCISVGFIYLKNKELHFRVKSFADDDEVKILTDFAALVNKFCVSRNHTFCRHNIKEFDIPYICRRMLVNGIPLPNALQISGKKPWEITFYDTLEMWKFGDFKNFTSLKLLTAIFGIPTPKDDIDGSQVATVYYDENNLQRISVYCQKDVVATAQVFLKINFMPMINVENVEYVGSFSS